MKLDLTASLRRTMRGEIAPKSAVTSVTPVTCRPGYMVNSLKLLALRVLQVKNSKLANRPVTSAVIVTAEPDVEREERKAMASHSVPEPYLDGWARLQCQKPMAVSAEKWRQAIDAAGRFLNAWGVFAVEFQWTPGELRDVPRHGERCGLIWFLGGETVRALGPAHAITESGRNFLREVDFDAGLCRKGPLND